MATHPSLLDHHDLGNEVLGLAETAGRYTLVLLVMEGDLSADRGVQFLGDRLVPDTEQELLRGRARNRDHLQLPFPCLAKPPLLGKLLDVAGPLAGGVAPGQGTPSVDGKETYH